MPGPIFVYYSLEGFYQNHRRYIASLDYEQLRGQNQTWQNIRSNCYPYSNIKNKIIAPCGAIANSMFMDRFRIRFRLNNHKYNYIFIQEKHISWPSDKFVLFKNPPTGFGRFEKPINWSIRVDELDLKDANNNGFQNEHLMVWMKVAAFSTFRKLWGRINIESLFPNEKNLPPGSYQLEIDYGLMMPASHYYLFLIALFILPLEYPTVFNNLRIAKKVIISNTSWMGGKNYFLPIVYFIVAILCLCIGTLFICISIHFPPKQQQQQQPQLVTDYQATQRNQNQFINTDYIDTYL